MLVQNSLLSDATSPASRHHAQYISSSSTLCLLPPQPCSFVYDIWSMWRMVNSIRKRREEETAWVPGWEDFSWICAEQAWTCHWCKPKHHWCSLTGTSGGSLWWGLHQPWVGPQWCCWCSCVTWADDPALWCCAAFSRMEARQLPHNGSFPLELLSFPH